MTASSSSSTTTRLLTRAGDEDLSDITALDLVYSTGLLLFPTTHPHLPANGSVSQPLYSPFVACVQALTMQAAL